MNSSFKVFSDNDFPGGRDCCKQEKLCQNKTWLILLTQSQNKKSVDHLCCFVVPFETMLCLALLSVLRTKRGIKLCCISCSFPSFCLLHTLAVHLTLKKDFLIIFTLPFGMIYFVTSLTWPNDFPTFTLGQNTLPPTEVQWRQNRARNRYIFALIF